MEQPLNPNVRAAALIAQELERSGVTDACLSPGSRSTAMVLGVLRARGIRPWVVLDERSAGFFALGMARERRRPVMLLCTSGTAAANYLPAAVEAAHAKIPLIIITADRPPEARDCRSPQTINQVGIFGAHARWSVDVLTPTAGIDSASYYRTLACRAVAAATEPPAGPVHLNLPMREPLCDVDEETSALATLESGPREGAVVAPYARVHHARAVPEPKLLLTLAETLRRFERGVLVCGPGAGADGAARAIAGLARRLGWPVLADALSGLRLGMHDRSMVVDAYDVLLRSPAFCERHEPDAVIQFGDPAVSKALSQFLAAGAPRLHVMVAQRGSWPDPLHVATDVVRADAALFCEELTDAIARAANSTRWVEGWMAASARVRETLDVILSAEETMFEGKVMTELVRLLPEGAALHVGNSMPVRDLDTFVRSAERNLDPYCNRGANGIDGVVSSAMGAAAAGQRPVALAIGDLSFIHDLGALEIAARHPIHLLVVVINNDGGGIFSFLPQAALGSAFEKFFATPHGLDLERAVELCGARYVRADSWRRFASEVETALASPALHVIEVASDRRQNVELHRRFIASALARLDTDCGEETPR